MTAAATDLRFAYRLQRDEFQLDVDCSLSSRGITGVFGPSGAGKTTLLRCLAGLERADSASFSAMGANLDGSQSRLPVHKRGIGYVFQEARLFPHMSVDANLHYGLRRTGPHSDIDVEQLVDTLALRPLLTRRPASLSGGEAQRVAIGRALLGGPRLLLMDEPVASLDTAHRHEVLDYIDRLHARVSTPMLYVSHSIGEICRLCDQLIVMQDGRAAAMGDLQEVLLRTDLPVLAGDEAGGVLIGHAAEYDAAFDLTRIQLSGGDLHVPGRYDKGQELRLRIRASDVSVSRTRAEDTSILNRLDVELEEIVEDSPHSVLLTLKCGDDALLARITRRSCADLSLARGDALIAQLKSVSARQRPASL